MPTKTVLERDYRVGEHFRMGGVEVTAVWEIHVAHENVASATLYVALEADSYRDAVENGAKAVVEAEDVPRPVFDQLSDTLTDDRLAVDRELSDGGDER